MSKKEFLIHRPHPWHGITTGDLSPKIVTAYVEITSNEVIKYEICKKTGYLKVDRPQRFSSAPGTLYGFIPQTYSAEKTASLSSVASKGAEVKSVIKALPSQEVSLNGDASQVLDISQVRIDDSAVLISSSRP